MADASVSLGMANLMGNVLMLGIMAESGLVSPEEVEGWWDTVNHALQKLGRDDPELAHMLEDRVEPMIATARLSAREHWRGD